MFQLVQVAANKEFVDGVSTMDMIINQETKVWARVFLPVFKDAAKKVPVVFFFHGGAFALLSADDIQFDSFCRSIAKAVQAVVISVDFRRSPEHKFPTAYNDCFDGLRWLQSEALNAGKGPEGPWLPTTVDVANCYLVGDSAGGNIVHNVGIRAAQADLSPVVVVGHILLQPWFSSEERLPSLTAIKRPIFVTAAGADFYWRAFLPEGANRDHPACNVVGPNSSGLAEIALPKTLVIVGELDPLKDWQTQYVDHLNGLDKNVKLVFYKDTIHGFYVFKNFKEADLVLEEIDSFINNSSGDS